MVLDHPDQHRMNRAVQKKIIVKKNQWTVNESTLRDFKVKFMKRRYVLQWLAITVVFFFFPFFSVSFLV